MSGERDMAVEFDVGDDDVVFELGGEKWVLLRDVERWNVGEVRTVHRWLQRSVTAMPFDEHIAASIWVTIHRERPDFRPADVDALPWQVLNSVWEQLAAILERAAATKQGRPPARPQPADDDDQAASSATSTT